MKASLISSSRHATHNTADDKDAFTIFLRVDAPAFYLLTMTRAGFSAPIYLMQERRRYTYAFDYVTWRI